MTIGIWNVGSVSNHVGGFVGWDNITAISGTTLDNMVCQEINYANDYTTETITEDEIQPKFQPTIIDLTISKVLVSTEANEGGVDEVDLGPLTVKQGEGGNAELAKQMRIDATTRLKELGRKVRFKRVLSGC